jgi:hypothetical protein
MNATTRTVLIGLVAALAAIGGGVVVADASNHASFAASATQDRLGAFGRSGAPPAGGQRLTPPPGVPQGDR